jgi:hypothetical protein
MNNGVIKFEEKCYLELYPKSSEDSDYIFEIKKEQWELVNKILQTTNAKFIQIDNRTFNVSAIRQVYKKPYATEIPYGTTIIENEITPEQRKRNQEALDELREQLKNNLLIK